MLVAYAEQDPAPLMNVLQKINYHAVSLAVLAECLQLLLDKSNPRYAIAFIRQISDLLPQLNRKIADLSEDGNTLLHEVIARDSRPFELIQSCLQSPRFLYQYPDMDIHKKNKHGLSPADLVIGRRKSYCQMLCTRNFSLGGDYLIH